MTDTFYVAVTHGWLEVEASGKHRNVDPPLTAMVLDRLRCHRVVAEYRSEPYRSGYHSRAYGNAHALALAEAKAAELNALEAS